MGITHRIGDGNGREWKTTSMGMGIPMGIYSHIVYNTKGAVYLNLKYEGEPDRERFNTVIMNDQDFCTVSMMM